MGGGTARLAIHDHVVGESWSGRACEVRDLLGRCAIPHSFCLADSNDGRALVAEAGEGAKLPIVVFSRRHGPDRPQQRRDGERGGLAGEPGTDGFRPCDRRRRTGWSVGSRVWRLGRIQHLGGRRRRAQGPGHLQFADSQLPRLPSRGQRSPSGSAGVRAGARSCRGRPTLGANTTGCSSPSLTAAACVPARCSWRRAPAIADSASRRSRR